LAEYVSGRLRPPIHTSPPPPGCPGRRRSWRH
jgi:hypothetical protein